MRALSTDIPQERGEDYAAWPTHAAGRPKLGALITGLESLEGSLSLSEAEQPTRRVRMDEDGDEAGAEAPLAPVNRGLLLIKLVKASKS